MSIAVMARIWQTATELSGSELLVLLALADFGDDTGGNIYPSMTTLAGKARLSESQARRVVRRLVEAGYVEIVEAGGWDGQRNRANEYQIVFDRGSNMTPPSADTRTGGSKLTPRWARRRQGGGRVDATTVGAPARDQSPYNHHEQPSCNEEQGSPPLQTDAHEPQNSGGGGFDSVLEFWRGAGFGEMRPGVEAGLRELEERHGADEVIAALRIADEASSADENKRTLRYIRGIVTKRARDRAREEMLDEAHTAGVYGLPRRPSPEAPEPRAIRLLREIAQLRESPMEMDGDVVRIAVRAPEVAERQYTRLIERTLGSAGLLGEVSWEFTDLKTGEAGHGQMPGVRERNGQAEEHLRDPGQPRSAVANGVR